MNLSGIIEFLTEHPEFQRLLKAIGDKGASSKEKSRWEGVVLDAAKPALIAALHLSLNKPMLVLTARPEVAKELHEQIDRWASSGSIQLFPEPDVLPYEPHSWETSIALDRLKVLHLLSSRQKEAPLVVASLPAVLNKTLSKDYFASSCVKIDGGGRIEPSYLLEKLTSIGYEAEKAVEVPGTFSRRGGIIDVYSPAEEHPVRLELFGNQVESLRRFDSNSQRSIDSTESMVIIPAKESLLEHPDEVAAHQVIEKLNLSDLEQETQGRWMEDLERFIGGASFEGREYYAPLFQQGTFFDYLPRDTLLIQDDPLTLQITYQELNEQARQLRQQQVSNRKLPKSFPKPYLEWRQISKNMDSFRACISLNKWEAENTSSARFEEFTPTRNYGGHLKVFLRELQGLLRDGHGVAIVSHQASRLSELLQELDIIAPVTDGIPQTPPSSSMTLVQGSLSEGWILKTAEEAPDSSLVLFTDKEIFGVTKQRREVKRRPVHREAFASDISVGDYAVHVDHGIGRFIGVTTMKREGAEREYLTLEYADEAKLYVPNDHVDRVSPYVGPSDKAPRLTRLGGMEWAKAKRRVKESAEEVAKELLTLYSKREAKSGYAFSPDTEWQHELEASFPYMETPDQLETIQQMKIDMEQPRPMDRLVCGDVGYGKTEVALRAAFKAVMDGKQVAVLVPTTVLAQQHIQTFKDRLKAFPVRVEALSRFLTDKGQKDVVEGLKSGSVDICIGTHRLVQKDVKFKDLGLVIIDEEQRFGVNHKETLKRMKEEVDVLNLSATPIPRTLHMSLIGVRDMSTMETPPEERLPIKTYVQQYDAEVVREAILREMDRGGQVFLVHNRVQDIDAVAERVRRLVPNADIAVAHGQMPEHHLEEVMVEFAGGQYDVLVCTTIIESGLDMPNVNTIIIHQAENMGLSQLYQLRGRVGRGVDRAYAYFLFNSFKALSEVAEKRLKAIQAATELGAGFRIAMKDLEIRGAGNLLGVEQSGHIASVGFDLYSSMLARAVEELREQGYQGLRPADGRTSTLLERPITSIDIPIPAYIPQEYVPEMDLRLALYQRFARVNDLKGVDDVSDELEDRFGEHPAEVTNLLYLVRIKILAVQHGISRIGRQDGSIVVTLGEGAELDRNSLSACSPGVGVGTRQVRLNISKLEKRWQDVLERVIQHVETRELTGSSALP